MDTSSDNADGPADHGSAPCSALAYRLCPRCLRAVPTISGERYCVNDGTRLLESCPQCTAPITSPYARFCTRCGAALTWPGLAAAPP
ncbi:zinc ribbon domain-containing protein [Deinococcus hopiensis]|uniref:zinc ribbon domain-containing protein n=1 Tax=Deinococcus hopiensis TaxID=309885 RepID=UPI00148289E8|nr:zinc ribbon domain-containing protein [Deinococcus hopiensis]